MEYTYILKCIFISIIRPALLYGVEIWTITAKKESMLERTEIRILRWMTGVSLRDKIKSKEI